MRNFISKMVESVRIDDRSLAAFRITAAGCVIYKALLRLLYVNIFFTDSGLCPRSFIRFHPLFHKEWSPFFYSGDALPAVLMLSAVIGVAVFMMIGYKTRLATFLCWLGVVLIDGRDSWIANGGDTYLVLVLVWGMLLPLGNVFSVDAHLRSRKGIGPEKVSFWASLGVLSQISMVYFFAGYYKDRTEWLYHRSELLHIMRAPDMATSLAHFMSEFPHVMRALSAAVYLLELIGPFLLFASVVFSFLGGPWSALRTLMVSLFMLLHVWILLTLKLNMMPWIFLAGLLLLVPGSAWNRLNAVPDRPLSRRGTFALWVDAAAILLLLYIAMCNLVGTHRIYVPKSVLAIGERMHLNQRWSLFSRYGNMNEWYAMPGVRADGKRVDAWQNKDLFEWTDPGPMKQVVFGEMIRKCMNCTLYNKHLPKIKEHVAQYYCREWNETHAAKNEKLLRIYIYKVTREADGKPDSPLHRTSLGHFQCS